MQSNQGTEAWFKSRLGRFTASQISRLIPLSRDKKSLGSGAYTYIKEKVAEIISGSDDRFSNAATERGNNLEAEAVAYYEKKTGNTVYVPAFIPYGEFSGGSPDGLVMLNKTIQIKCPAKRANHVEFLMMQESEDLKKIEAKYWWQVQMEMLATGRPFCDFVSYHPDFPEPYRLKILTVHASQEDQEILKDRIEKAAVILTEMVSNIRNANHLNSNV